MTGLVLTAGGARGAYQAGVLKRVGELPIYAGRPSPFPIVCGASAGAINGALIAAGSSDFGAATAQLAAHWCGLSVQDVYRADFLSLTAGGVRWLRDLSLGGLVGSAGGSRALLDASPLRGFLERNLPVRAIGSSIRSGHLFALAISATSYYSGKSFTFIEGRPGHPLWYKSRRVSLSVQIDVDHILASAAIPIVFPPVLVRTPIGEFFFGDGALRLVAPFSPAIRLGADRVLAIGIRSQRAAEVRSLDDLLEAKGAADDVPTLLQPPLAQIVGVMLNAIFLDHLDADVDHLVRMNELIASYGSMPNPASTSTYTDAAPAGGEENRQSAIVHEPMRIVTPLIIDPSEDLAGIAEGYADRLPRMVRIAMEGLGASRAQSADLLSYLLFDSAYTNALVDIGYHDANERVDEIEEFLRSSTAIPAELNRKPWVRTAPLDGEEPDAASFTRPRRVVVKDLLS